MNEIKTDCFGYRNPTRCGVLSDMICKHKKCSFYKTKKQFAEDKIKYDLLTSVDKAQ